MNDAGIENDGNNKIITYSKLLGFVEVDQIDHEIKELAILFLTAMNNWPTQNQDKIGDFVTELKTYFGFPLTIQKIEEKTFNGQNAWQLEAGSSIKELIRMSEKFFNTSNFDQIVRIILDFYTEFIKKTD